MLTGTCHCGVLAWRFGDKPETATACSCTICRRYGALWAYGWEDDGVSTSGASTVYAWGDNLIGFHFCSTCGCLGHYRALAPDDDGRRKIAVNLRMIDDPTLVAAIPVNHFDGLDTWARLPRDERCVADMWF